MTQPRNRTQRRRGTTSRTSPPKRVELRYIKTTAFPVLHVDGVYGGMTPQLSLYLAFFSEHAKLPESATLEWDPEGGPAREIGQRKPEWVRDVGLEVTMSISVAEALRKLLDDKIAEVGKLIAEHNPDSPVLNEGAQL